MAGRGRRTGGTRRTPQDTRTARHEDAPWTGPAPGDGALVRIHDLAGRPRGTGFFADHHGTVLTSHETVDGLVRLVLRDSGGRSCVVTADAVTPLPEIDLALVRTEGLRAEPLPITARDRIANGTYVRIAAGCWREARVLGATSVTYTATDRFHLLDDVLELAIGTAGRDALRLGGGAAGGPVIDASTGAVVAVLGTALQTGRRDIGFAVTPRRTESGPLAELLARNAATVPAYGADLNLAGVLELTATSVGQDGPPGTLAGHLGGTGAAACGEVEPVERAETVGEFAAFTVGPAAVLGLVGPPGSGRTTELAALAARRHLGPEPAPTLWLRGADLMDDDASLADAAGRALTRAARIVAASRSVSLPETGDIGPGGLDGLGPDGPVSGGSMSGGGGDGAGGTGSGPGGAGGGRLRSAVGGSGRGRHAGPGHGGSGWRGADRGDTEAGGRPSGGPGAGVDGGGGRTRSVAGVPGRGRHTDVAQGSPGRRDADAGDAHLVDLPAGPGDPDREGLPGALGDTTPERLAALACAAGRPLLLLLDGPEEMPPALAGRLTDWTDGTARWLRETGARLVVACRTEYWERAGAEFPPEVLHAGRRRDRGRAGLPPCVLLADLSESETREALARYDLPDDALTASDARHPLTLRLLSEVCAAHPDAPAVISVDRYDVLTAHLDLMCLRVAARLAAERGLRGTAVRRLAARVAGQVHEAARRSLGRGQGELDRASFEVLFPWGTAPARLGGGAGWASAVLAEGLLVPAGTGYRFAHEEFADWIQGMHLDLDDALRALVHSAPLPGRPPSVPPHRIGPVVQALLLVARQQGTGRLARRLEELTHALDADPRSWWAARLLAETLHGVPDATAYVAVLRLLADRIPEWRRHQQFVPQEFGPAFWTELPLAEAERFDLLRRLVRADPADGPGDPAIGQGRYLDTVSRLLARDTTAVQPHLVRWFEDGRVLPATPRATVATAAQALLHTHRHRALDDLTEALVAHAHRHGDELLAVLAEEEPSAVCRAVDRWAHDDRAARRKAAVTYGLRAAPHARTQADRDLLRYAALALLARPADGTLHGGALGILVTDPRARARHLPRAVEHFVAGDPRLPASALAAALTTHPEPVLGAFRARLQGPDAEAVLRALADVTTPALGRRVADLVREAVARHPEHAPAVAAYVDRRLDQGPAAHTFLFPLVTGVLDGGPEPVRTALAAVLAGPGPLRRELREFLLTHERDPAVLESLLRAVVRSGGDEPGELVRRTGLLLVRTPEGATRFDRTLVDLGRTVPGFAARVTGWLADSAPDWAAVVGPSARRTIENLAGVRIPA
ncbi:serine protease [Streptomyces sp. AS58]|uniref:serine protease n=1 Tax=Streptomyces sp. AS58 TaxID=1519489 RepID=UPI000B008013|nr:serine protease [Streptomyces sp. AS58]